jgi:hypothetical protein
MGSDVARPSSPRPGIRPQRVFARSALDLNPLIPTFSPREKEVLSVGEGGSFCPDDAVVFLAEGLPRACPSRRRLSLEFDGAKAAGALQTATPAGGENFRYASCVIVTE